MKWNGRMGGLVCAASVVTILLSGCAELQKTLDTMSQNAAEKEKGAFTCDARPKTFDASPFAKVAVIDQRARQRIVTEENQRQIEDEFVAGLLDKNYGVASRSDVESIASEQRFQNDSGMTDSDASRLGKMLNVPAIFIVSVTESRASPTKAPMFSEPNQRYYEVSTGLSVRMVSVEKGQVLWLGRCTAKKVSAEPENAKANLLTDVAKAVAANLPNREPAK